MSASRNRVVTVDEYIAMFPRDVQYLLNEVRKAIQESAPNAQETISYGIPTFKLNGNLVHFGAFKNHIGFYPGGPSAIEVFKEELSPFKQGKGSVQFPLDKPIPLRLLKKIVRFRVKQNENRYSKKC
ncbi:MAG: iron chaperone [Candidatus Sifarchaeia archaeon]